MGQIVMGWLAGNVVLVVALWAASTLLGRSVRARADRDRREMLDALNRLGLGPTTEPGGVPTPATHRGGRGVARIHTPGQR